MSDEFILYYWTSYIATAVLAFKVPTKMSRDDNVFGTLTMALFGFVLWPLVLVAYLKSRPQHDQ